METKEKVNQRVYCAGPLFNEPERREMSAICTTLELAGYETFLPQRDGFELARLQPALTDLVTNPAEAANMLDRAIFYLDSYMLLGWADAVVANLNGRVPDEGTVVEVALGWYAGKAVVLYKQDDRAPFSGRDNPMLTGLAELRSVAAIPNLSAAVAEQLATLNHRRVEEVLEMGKRIAEFRKDAQTGPGMASLARTLVQAFRSHR